MVLADGIRALRANVVADLTAAHNYYTDTKIAWGIVLQFITSGEKLAITNVTTGTVTTEKDLADKLRGYVTEQLAEATFQQFISIFENFFFDLLRLWLEAYPRNLSGRKVDFQEVLDAPDKDAITSQVVGRELNELSYKRPIEWFTYLEDKAKLGCPTQGEIASIAEAKASRDALVHNRGMASKIYETKAGNLGRYKVGQRVDIPEDYHRATWELLRKMVIDICDAAIKKTQ